MFDDLNAHSLNDRINQSDGKQYESYAAKSNESDFMRFADVQG
jgi:hypothetical protein